MIGRRDNTVRREGASLSRTHLRDQYLAWLQHHRLSAADSLLRVLESPGASLLTWLVLGIALALPVGLSVALDNADRLSSGWDNAAQISLFLAEEVTVDRSVELQTELRGRREVAETTFVSREQALGEFGSLSGFADILASLQDNPLPDLILVNPLPSLENAEVSQLRTQLEALPEVQEAVLDMQWVQRLNSFMELGQRLVLAIGAMLLLGVVLILGNTIRLAIENRRDEIVIVKLVGGSNAFVRRPFLYTGLWYGVGSGVVAGLLVTAFLWYLEKPVQELALLYEGAFQLQGLGLMGGLNLIIIGGALGLAGAWLAVARHLARIEPR